VPGREGSKNERVEGRAWQGEWPGKDFLLRIHHGEKALLHMKKWTFERRPATGNDYRVDYPIAVAGKKNNVSAGKGLKSFVAGRRGEERMIITGQKTVSFLPSRDRRKATETKSRRPSSTNQKREQ